MLISWRRGFLFRDDWRAPRSIVCGMFWVAIFVLFVGMILMVISKHKGRSYVIWGGVLLGFGFCIVLVCFLLCLNAYRILAQKNKLPQTFSQQKYNLAMPSSTIVYSTSATQPLNYPHIFVPIHPPKLETSVNVPTAKRSEFEKTVSFDRNATSTHEVPSTPSRKKKVRLQNGDAFNDKGCAGDDVVTGSTPAFSSPREMNFNKPLPSSLHDMSKLRHNVRGELFKANEQIKGHRAALDGRPEYLTDDEILCKTYEKDLNVHGKAHSRTLSQSYQRTAGGETLVENIGSTRVKVRPIQSRLYSPEWVGNDANLQSMQKEDDMINVIHF